MSIEQSSKEMATGLVYITFGIGTSLVKALCRSILALKYASAKYGEQHYKDYLKGEKGHRFKNLLDFVRVTYDTKKSDMEQVSVSKDDRYFLEKLTRNMNIDYYLGRKPDNIEQLVVRKYIYNEKLSDYDEKIVRTFTIRDEKGNVVMNPDNPQMPLIKDDEYVLVFAQKDLNKWEFIARELEKRCSEKSIDEKLNDIKKKQFVERVQKWRNNHKRERTRNRNMEKEL